MTREDPNRLAARADLARLLSACYYEPGEAFIEEKMLDSLVTAARGVDGALGEQAEQVAQAFGAEALQTLLIDYTRLFLAPEGPLAQPYGSVWLGGTQPLMQDSTLAVEAMYEQAGFAVDEEVRDLPDHIAVELEFVYALLFRQAQALSRGDAGDAEAAATLRRQFIAAHLKPWIGAFAAAVAAGAQSDFYRALATLTERFVAGEANASA